MRKRIGVWAVVAGLVGAAPLHAQTVQAEREQPRQSDTKVEIGTGAFYQSGDYGTGQRIETLSVPLNLIVTTGRVRFSASLPYLRTTAPANVIVNGGGLLGLPVLSSQQTHTERTRRDGLGDLTLAGDYFLPVSGVEARIGAAVKLPTASTDKGLGTGKVDYAVRAGVAKPIGRVTPFADIACNFIGKPQAFSVRNGISASAGARLRVSNHVVTTAAYDYAEGNLEGGGDQQSVRLGLNAALTDHIGLGLYGAKGVSDAAADTGSGVQLGYAF